MEQNYYVRIGSTYVYFQELLNALDKHLADVPIQFIAPADGSLLKVLGERVEKRLEARRLEEQRSK